MESRDRSQGKELYSSELQMRLIGQLEELGVCDSCKGALRHATELHKNQKPRPDGSYVNHILRVTLRLTQEYGVTDPDLIIAALLHDAVEDQAKKLAPQGNHDAAVEMIVKRYGARVGKIVRLLSVPKRKAGMTREDRFREYTAHVEATIEDPDVALIKLADFSDNALRLDQIKDQKRRVRMTQKYLPVITLFIYRLQRGDLPLAPEKKTEMIERLHEAKDSCKQFLNT
jgi:(p)ppGpp synthase/HD superfamily hydrolase